MRTNEEKNIEAKAYKALFNLYQAESIKAMREDIKTKTQEIAQAKREIKRYQNANYENFHECVKDNIYEWFEEVA